jgi:hypothetical protein
MTIFLDVPIVITCLATSEPRGSALAQSRGFTGIKFNELAAAAQTRASCRPKAVHCTAATPGTKGPHCLKQTADKHEETKPQAEETNKATLPLLTSKV